MIQKTKPVVVLLSCMAAAGCSSGGGGNTTASNSSNTSNGSNSSNNSNGSNTSGGSCNATVVASEANDYSFSSTLTFPPVSVKPKSDLSIDWTNLTADFVGHSLDPKKDVGMVSIFMWSLPLDQLQTKLNADSLTQMNLTVVPITFTPGADGGAVKTTASLYEDFTFVNQATTPDVVSPYFDPTMYDPSMYTYTVIVSSGTTLGQGARMIQSFKVDPASTNTAITVSNDSTKLTYTANLHSLTQTNVPANKAAITLDWGMMHTNALGNPFTLGSITHALVAHYTQTPTELESKFLDLELIATELYQGDIPSGTVVDFSMLQDSSGKSFSGIDSTGTWIVALQCGDCRNPAPWYLSVLKPCGG
jgi:hypothetical protein